MLKLKIMKNKISMVILLACLPLLNIYARENFAIEEWRFCYGDQPQAEHPDFDDRSWKAVRIPHDWAIDRPFDMSIDMQSVMVKEDQESVPQLRTGRTGALPCFGVGWYRTKLTQKVKPGQRVNIQFDGTMSLSKVFLNGKFIGEWPYGYTSYHFDLTDNWNFNGDNILSVRLENKPESSRWYSGAGIYRNVRLSIHSPLYIPVWGTFITTPVATTQKGIAKVATEIRNQIGENKLVKLKTSILSMDGNVLKTIITTRKIAQVDTIVQEIVISKPTLWNIDTPYLYTLKSEVFVGDKLFDTITSDFGFRTIAFDANTGFKLNNKEVKIKGVCLHHDLGPLGAAVNCRAIERQLQMMKEMGANAIRTSHNPPTPELLEICDRMGLMVQVEAFDEWRIAKNANGYHNYFDKWAKKDIEAMIHRDRNHPSIIMWSIGNEIREQNDPNGWQVGKMLVEICKEADPTRPVTAGFNQHNQAIKYGLGDQLDLVGFNYKPHDYKRFHDSHPNYILFGCETASTVSSRGEYKFPVKEKKGVYYEDYQVSSYDLEYPSWASTPDTEWFYQDTNDFVFGEFVWTGFDYLGEPTPYNSGTPARSSYFGIVDLAGLKKDRYYLYQSRWCDTPVLHLLPHWNWAERGGDKIPVYCYTNYPQAELFVNGKSQGVKSKSTASKYDRYRLMWNDVIYTPGEIKVVASDHLGNKVDSTTIRTASASYGIRLTPDRKEIQSDGKDLSFVTVEIVDKDGNLCPTANHLLFFEVNGAGALKALCNGDATDQSSFVSSYMKTFNGKLVLVVEGGFNEGNIDIKVYGGHLKAASERLTVSVMAK